MKDVINTLIESTAAVVIMAVCTPFGWVGLIILGMVLTGAGNR